jgi:NACalpha-BTF3-like transcription factor
MDMKSLEGQNVMQLRNVIDLSEDDIIRLIAEKYDVDKDKVALRVTNGDLQYPINLVYATVSLVH